MDICEQRPGVGTTQLCSARAAQLCASLLRASSAQLGLQNSSAPSRWAWQMEGFLERPTVVPSCSCRKQRKHARRIIVHYRQCIDSIDSWPWTSLLHFDEKLWKSHRLTCCLTAPVQLCKSIYPLPACKSCNIIFLLFLQSLHRLVLIRWTTRRTTRSAHGKKHIETIGSPREGIRCGKVPDPLDVPHAVHCHLWKDQGPPGDDATGFVWLKWIDPSRWLYLQGSLGSSQATHRKPWSKTLLRPAVVSTLVLRSSLAKLPGTNARWVYLC